MGMMSSATSKRRGKIMEEKKLHQLERQNRWRRDNAYSWQLQLNKENDADIIEWLHLMGRSAAGHVRKLIRDDIKKEGK